MPGMHIQMSGEPPMPPRDADFAFKIDFVKGAGEPRRVFDAASELIDAFELLDEALIQSVDSKIEPVLLLEDIESSSLKVWLKNVLKRTDDEALKTIDWRPLIGRYLVKSKYLVLRFLDEDGSESGKAKIEHLKEGLRQLAQETDVRHLPDYAPIHDGKLVAGMDRVQSAKRELAPGDKLFIETEEQTYEVDLTSTWQPSESIPVENVKETHSEGEIILTIRKPDFLGSSMWQFGHGKSTVSAKISDDGWLVDFHNRKIPLYSGDALRCKAKFTFVYDEAGNLIEQKTEITKVVEVIKGPGPQATMF